MSETNKEAQLFNDSSFPCLKNCSSLINNTGSQQKSSDDTKCQNKNRLKGFQGSGFFQQTNNSNSIFQTPIKPRFIKSFTVYSSSTHNSTNNVQNTANLERVPSNNSLNYQHQSKISLKAGNLFKKFGTKKGNINISESKSIPGTHENDILEMPDSALNPHSTIRRKMSTLVHGADFKVLGKNSNPTSLTTSRRNSVTSTITSSSIPSQKQNNQVAGQNKQNLLIYDGYTLSKNPSLFDLNFDFNNLSDFTNSLPAHNYKNEAGSDDANLNKNREQHQDTGTEKFNNNTRTDDIRSSHTLNRAPGSSQWIPPESWNVDEPIRKSISTLNRRRKQYLHQRQENKQTKNGAHMVSNNDQSLHNRFSNYERVGNKYRTFIPETKQISYESHKDHPNPKDIPLQDLQSDPKVGETDEKTYKDSSLSLNHIETCKSISSGSIRFSDEETLSATGTSFEHILRTRSLDSICSQTTDEAAFNEFIDLKNDKAEYQLEKYYNEFSDVDYQRKYVIRIFNTDNTFTTLSCLPNTTVHEMIPQIRRKFNINIGNYQVSLKVGKISKILEPTAKPILIQRRLLLLNGYQKNDPLYIMGVEDLSFVFKFIFHPVATSQLTYEQEQKLGRGDFVHVDLRNIDLTAPPVIFYQYTSDIETLDISNNANIFLPLDFIESAIKLSSLRIVNNRASKFPANISEAYRLVSLDLERNFIRKIPESISKLKNLTILNLQCNALVKLPKGFRELKNLQLLDISSNKFVNYPEVINYCTNLLQIDISYNKIHEIPDSINKLTKLAKLNLSNNRINRIGNLSSLINLRTLNLRYNRITSLESKASNLQNLFLTNNRLCQFQDNLSKLRTLEIQENPITHLSYNGDFLEFMTSLSLNKAKLSSLPADLLKKLPNLEKLEINDNNLTQLPSEFCQMTRLVYLSVAKNKLESFPEEIFLLRSLKILDAHSNNLRRLPVGLKNIELTKLNVSSNLLTSIVQDLNDPTDCFIPQDCNLAQSLLFFNGADNNFTDAFWKVINNFTNLKILNVSYNNFMTLGESNLENLTELYLSGNNWTTLPGEPFLKLKSLKVLMLNGNNLLSLPAELSLLRQLSVLDVGSNQLKYNISNFHYDWNWRENTELKYLNFSGNKRFEIKSALNHESKQDLSDFFILKQLRVLGLMDVTLKTSKVPDDGVNFRLRTTASMINGMRYGVADTLGQRDFVSTRDVTFERFRGKEDECLICLHDGCNENTGNGHKISQIIRDIYDKILIRSLEKYGDDENGIKTGLRFSFLQLNKEINGMLVSVDNHGGDKVGLSSADLLSGSSVTVVYIKGKKVYTANIGNTVAIISKSNGDSETLTELHVPSKRKEYERIRISGGYVNNKKLDGVSKVSRAVGFFDLLPHIHASPDISEITLSYTDEMLIIATYKLWEYVDLETVCDIARECKSHPMQAAEKMKDYAIAYGCTENLTILCVSLDKNVNEQKQFTVNKSDLIARKMTFEDTTLRRLQPEIDPPTGTLAIVFTDIKNSTFLWELFPNAMRTAIKTHNDIMRRQLRILGGYEVKTEGDAFMVSFPTPCSALVWCLTIQLKLLEVEWPEEITTIQDGCLITDNEGNKIYQGLSVRMGIHWGCPVPEIDVVTQRMDYLGPMVNKAARVSSIADGGQITLSNDFIAEFNKIMKYHERVINNRESLKDVYGEDIIGEVIEREIQTLEDIGWVFNELGEQKLKGLETKEFITIAYPESLKSRYDLVLKRKNSNLIGDEFLFQLRTVSNKLENILSSLNAGVVELEALNNQHMTDALFDNHTKEFGVSQSLQTDWISFLDHLVTRVESSVALLQLRQSVSGGFRTYKPEDFKYHKSIFDLLDDILKDRNILHENK